MHAVGTVINIKGAKFVVCGFRPFDSDGSVGVGYLVVPYPLGFVNVDSFSLVSSAVDYSVVHAGFKNAEGKACDQLLEQARDLGHKTTLDEVLAAREEAAKDLEAWAADAAKEE